MPVSLFANEGWPLTVSVICMADTVQSWTPEVAGAPARAKRSGMQRLVRRRSTIAFVMCLPLILVIVCLVVYPAFYSIFLSMLNKSQTRFVGLGNFTFLLSRDVFWMVVWQSTIFALSAVLF